MTLLVKMNFFFEEITNFDQKMLIYTKILPKLTLFYFYSSLPRRIEINTRKEQQQPKPQFSTFNSKIPAVELGYQVYKSHDSGISSNGFPNLSPNKREEGMK